MANTMPRVRSIPPASPAAGPAPRRRRRRANPLVVGGVLAAAVAALGFAALYTSAADTVAALAVARPVAAGHALADADLREVDVKAGPGVALVPAARRGALIGRRPAVPLVAGALLSEAQLAPERALEPGTVVAAVALKAGQYPPGLVAGDRVDVVVTGAAVALAGGTPPSAGVGGAVLARGARVAALAAATGAGGQAVVVSLVVDDAVGPDLVGAASAGQVGLLLAPSR